MDEIYARNTVARYIVSEVTRVWAENGIEVLDHEDFTEVGDDDWHRIEAEVLLLSINFRPPTASLETALDFLGFRADQEAFS